MENSTFSSLLHKSHYYVRIAVLSIVSKYVIDKKKLVVVVVTINEFSKSVRIRSLLLPQG